MKGKDLNSWFCCYAPADDPQYVMSVVIEEGGFGANSAMFAARNVLGLIYGVPDSSSVLSQNAIM